MKTEKKKTTPKSGDALRERKPPRMMAPDFPDQMVKPRTMKSKKQTEKA